MKIFLNLILVLSIMLFTQACSQTLPKKENFCKDPLNTGKIGTEGDCLGKLIVDTELLRFIVFSEENKNQKYNESSINNRIYNIFYLSLKKLKEKNNLESSYDHRIIYTGQVDDLYNLFNGINDIKGDITGWDVSNVLVMNGLFANSNFNQNISKWNVSNVHDMENMFYKNKEFNQPIGCWNVKSLHIAHNMFLKADKFNQKIGNWKKIIDNIEFQELKGMDESKEITIIMRNIILKSIFENISENELRDYANKGEDYFKNKVLSDLKPKGERLKLESCS